MGAGNTKRFHDTDACMPQIIYSQQAQSDIERVYVFLRNKDVETAKRAIFEIEVSISKQL